MKAELRSALGDGAWSVAAGRCLAARQLVAHAAAVLKMPRMKGAQSWLRPRARLTIIISRA